MEDKKQDQPMSQPDPETMHTTDPEDHMKGPISSLMQNIKGNAENNDHPQKEGRQQKEDRNADNRTPDDRTPEDNDQ